MNNRLCVSCKPCKDQLDIDCENCKAKIREEAIDEYTTELKSRLLDAITKEHLESMTNLINDVAEIVKEKQNE